MGNQINFYSLSQWCKDTNHEDFLELWDYDLNEVTPDKIGYMSTKKVWLKCKRSIHKSTNVVLQSVIKAYEKGKEYGYCRGCNSFAQFLEDNYNSDYYKEIWSDKNEIDPFMISKRSTQKIWLKCLNDSTHPDYDLTVGNFKVSHNCPYCAGKRVYETNSLGYKIPKSVELWSDKNDFSPYDVTPGSHKDAWFKCENGKHEDYKRMISRSVTYDLRCPNCGKENQYNPKGPDHPNWKGGVTTEAQALRKSPQYDKWRTAVYIKDNYTCQCCGQKGQRLTAHHLFDYASYPDLRLDEENGITLCFSCHDSTVSGSFHNTYGTHGKTPEQLEEYINNKRQELGIPIPFNIDEYKKGNVLKPGDVEKVKEFMNEWKFVPYTYLKYLYGPRKEKPQTGFVKMKPIYKIKED